MNINDIDFEKAHNTEMFKDYLQEMNKNKNINIYVPNVKRLAWVTVEYKTSLVNISLNLFAGLNFSSICKPSPQSGAGSRIFEMVTEPNLKHIQNTINRYYIYAKPFTNINEYFKSEQKFFKYEKLEVEK